MPRPSLLVLLLLMIFLTSWIGLKLNVVNEVEATAALLYKSSDPQQSFKEKVSGPGEDLERNNPLLKDQDSCSRIILSQEKSIQKLKELVQDLQKQLELCRVKTVNGVNDTAIQLTEFVDSIEHEW